MTDEQINAAIARACGWTKINAEHRSGINPTNGLRMGAEFFPKYVNDLNAMHAAEKTLTNANMYVMEYHIKAMGKGHGFYFHATARQRAEAFLLTLGKWEATTE